LIETFESSTGCLPNTTRSTFDFQTREKSKSFTTTDCSSNKNVHKCFSRFFFSPFSRSVSRLLPSKSSKEILLDFFFDRRPTAYHIEIHARDEPWKTFSSAPIIRTFFTPYHLRLFCASKAALVKSIYKSFYF
jgi:hypothetical protein